MSEVDWGKYPQGHRAFSSEFLLESELILKDPYHNELKAVDNEPIYKPNTKI